MFTFDLYVLSTGHGLWDPVLTFLMAYIIISVAVRIVRYLLGLAT